LDKVVNCPEYHSERKNKDGIKYTRSLEAQFSVSIRCGYRCDYVCLSFIDWSVHKCQVIGENGC